jgi:shikimate dehydrogenase
MNNDITLSDGAGGNRKADFTSCFIIGHPVAHSRSPMVHNHWIGKLGLSGHYERIDVPPEGLAAFVARLRDGEFAGGNVTLPHKQAIAPLLDGLTPAAQQTGAVNTVFRENGRLIGDNTDVTGFLGHLTASAPHWRQGVRRAVMLGAGGGAKAIAHGLLRESGAELVIVNRDPEKAKALAAFLAASPEPRVTARPWEERSAALEGADLIVNATALGMKGQPPLEIDLAGMAPGGLAYDIVYVPLETGMLRAARAAGLTPIDGLGMLLHQAAPAFARWFGVTPPVTAELRRMIEADIG